MPKIMDRLKAGLAAIRAEQPDMTAEDKDALERAEAAVFGVPQATVPTPEPTAKLDTETSNQLTALMAQNEQLAAQLKTNLEAERNATVLEMVKSGHILPAATKAAEALLSFGGETEKAFKAFLELNGKHAAMANNPKNDDPTNGSGVAQLASGAVSSDNSAIDTLATQYMQTHKCTYREALTAVGRENKGLIAAGRENLPADAE